MGRIFLIILFGILVSCSTPRKGVEEKTVVKPEASQTVSHDDNTYYLGEVQLLDCGVVIQMNYGETNYKYSPVNLDPKFKTDKLRLKLKFKVLDTQATECSEFRAIEITEAFAVR